MKRGVAILAFLTIVTIAGGFLTSGLFSDFPILIQSTDPNASVFEATPEQANLFIFWTMFVIANLVVIGGILAFLFWRGNAAVEQARVTPNQGTQDSDALPETASENA